MAEDSPARPRRSARAPARFGESSAVAVRASQPEARTARAVDPAQQLQTLLASSKSTLTNVDISTILNASTWNMLPEEARARLCTLLPPTAFTDFVPTVHPSHPSCTQGTVSNIHEDVEMRTAAATSLEKLDTSFFTDGHFLAAARTFQDHLYTGWLADAHKEKVQKYESGVRDGTLHAPWKDEVWERDHRSAPEEADQQTEPSSRQPDAIARAGDAAELKLVDLAKNSVIRKGDVLAYKRVFSQLNLVIEKDVIIQSVHSRSYAITVLIEPGTTKSLPPELLAANPADPDGPTKSMTVTSPNMLENGILDVDGRIERSRRPNGNAWKCLTVWRWRQEPEGDVDMLAFEERGGRENHGTLFYLRGCFYHDR